MPVPIKKKPKDTTGVKKKRVAAKKSTTTRKIAGAGANTTTTPKSSKAGTKAKKKTLNAAPKTKKSDATETTNNKNRSGVHGDRNKKGNQDAVSGVGHDRNVLERKQSKSSIHPEVEQLIEMLKSSIKQEYKDYKNIKKEECVTPTESPWGLDYKSSDSSDEETEYESDNADNSSHCSDDDEFNSSDDTSSEDEDSSDEYFSNDSNFDDSDEDVDESNDFDESLPSTSNAVPTERVKSNRVPKRHEEEPSTTRKDTNVQKKSIKKKAGDKTKRKQPSKKIKQKNHKPKTKIVEKPSGKAARSKITATVTTSNQTKNTNASVKNMKPLGEITNVCLPKAACCTHKPKVTIKKPCHSFLPTSSCLTKTKSSTSVSCARVRPCTPKACVKKSSTKLSTSPAINPLQPARRSVGVSCHLPDANSTFQNNFSNKFCRF